MFMGAGDILEYLLDWNVILCLKQREKGIGFLE